MSVADPDPRRQRAALEGWQAAIAAGRYAQVRYQTAPVIARDLQRLAAQIGLVAPAFVAGENITAHEVIGTTAPARAGTTLRTAVEKQTVPTRAPPTPKVRRDTSGPKQLAEAPDAAAGRQRLTDELLGMSESQPRGRWRRRFS